MAKTYETAPRETADKLMSTAVPVVPTTASVADIEQLLLKETKNFETINYVYVVDHSKKLAGVISIKEVFRAPKTTLVKELLPKEIISARAHTDQERVAFLSLKHNIKAIPIVDKEGLFLGTVPSDKILSILDKEAVENLLRFGGVSRPGAYDNMLDLSVWKSLKHRLPWLLLGLLGGVLIAWIINGFEAVLAESIILAAFIPLMLYMASAVATQAEILIIRDLAVNPKTHFSQYFTKQLIIVALIGLITGLLVVAAGAVLGTDLMVGVALAVALFLAILSSVFTGLVIPFLFSKMGLDPANASGPMTTIIQDALSVIIYFSVAAWLL